MRPDDDTQDEITTEAVSKEPPPAPPNPGNPGPPDVVTGARARSEEQEQEQDRAA
jgi:hypothetical protein